MHKKVKIGVLARDEIASQVALELVGLTDIPWKKHEADEDGNILTVVEATKRTRRFKTVPEIIDQHPVFQGQIDLHPKHDGFSDTKLVVFTTDVEVHLVTDLAEMQNGFDWLIVSTDRNPAGIFTSNPHKLKLCHFSPADYHQAVTAAPAPYRLAVYGSIQNPNGKQRENQYRQSANHLAATISVGRTD